MTKCLCFHFTVSLIKDKNSPSPPKKEEVAYRSPSMDSGSNSSSSYTLDTIETPYDNDEDMNCDADNCDDDIVAEEENKAEINNDVLMSENCDDDIVAEEEKKAEINNNVLMSENCDDDIVAEEENKAEINNNVLMSENCDDDIVAEEEKKAEINNNVLMNENCDASVNAATTMYRFAPLLDHSNTDDCVLVSLSDEVSVHEYFTTNGNYMFCFSIIANNLNILLRFGYFYPGRGIFVFCAYKEADALSSLKLVFINANLDSYSSIAWKYFLSLSYPSAIQKVNIEVIMYFICLM